MSSTNRCSAIIAGLAQAFSPTYQATVGGHDLLDRKGRTSRLLNVFYQEPAKVIGHGYFGCTKTAWLREGDGREVGLFKNSGTFGSTEVATSLPQCLKIGETFVDVEGDLATPKGSLARTT